MTTTIRQVRTPAGDPAWLVGGYDGVRALLTDPRLGRSHPDPERAARYSRSMIFGRPQPASPTERADHARMRRLLSPSFSARRLAGLRDRVSELVRGLLDEMERGGSPADLHEVLAFPLPVLVICELLGVPYTDREQFRRACDDAADMTDEARSMSGLATLWQYMVELVERKRSPLAGESRAGESRPGESDVEHVSDVLSDLLAAHVEDPAGLPTAEVAELGAALLFAGHETTVNAIDKGAVLLLTQPGRWDALGRDPELLAGAVEEILRLSLPIEEAPADRSATGLPRWAAADLDIAGTTVHAGELVLLDLHDANLDRRRFPAPTSLDPTRSDNPHLSFGHGPHYCIGAPLARIELHAVVAALVARFPGLRLAVPVGELRVRGERLTGGLAELPVTW